MTIWNLKLVLLCFSKNIGLSNFLTKWHQEEVFNFDASLNMVHLVHYKSGHDS